jgi:hypothetical protein
MGERTTFALKTYAIFLLVFIAFGLIDLYNSDWQIMHYDTVLIFGLSLVALVLLMLNNITGWIISFLCVLWILFNPVFMPYLKEGILIIFLKNPIIFDNFVFIELCIWSVVAIFILTLIILNFAKIRNYTFEVITGIYFLILSLTYLPGFLKEVLSVGFYLEQLFYPGIVLVSFIIFIVIAYFIKRKESQSNTA